MRDEKEEGNREAVKKKVQGAWGKGKSEEKKNVKENKEVNITRQLHS